jgi:phosphatidylinositol alpha-1,6-mannosyltransferase
MGDAASSGRRVLLITNNLPPVRGGSGIVYDNLARHGQGRIVVVAPKISYQDGLSLIGWREHDRLAPYQVIRLPLLRTVLLEKAPGWSRRVRFWLTDAVIRIRLLAVVLRQILSGGIGAVCIGELVASAWVLGILRLFPHITRAVYVHGEEITTLDDYDSGQARRRAALMTAHRIIVVSRFTSDAVRALLGPEARDRVHLIENGVDVDRFRPLPRSADLMTRYGLDGDFVFISVCRLLEKKGIDRAIQAFAQVAARYSGCRFLVVGEGPYRPTLERLARDQAVAGRIVFAGAVSEDELVEHYALGDVFVMPNRRLPDGDTEGFGLVFLEANACGLPVIAGSDGGSIDAVRDGVNGLLVDGHSVDAIAKAMLAVRGDPALRDRLRAGGLNAASVADWRHKARDFLALFDRKAD